MGSRKGNKSNVFTSICMSVWTKMASVVADQLREVNNKKLQLLSPQPSLHLLYLLLYWKGKGKLYLYSTSLKFAGQDV